MNTCTWFVLIFLISAPGLCLHVERRPVDVQHVLVVTRAKSARSVQNPFALSFNDSYPGPTLFANHGDFVEIVIKTQIPDLHISLHVHGMPQVDSAWFDGVPYVTECPLSIGEASYRFIASTTGTFFYHSHSAYQMMDGLIGAFVVDTKPLDEPVLLISGGWAKPIAQVLAMQERMMPKPMAMHMIHHQQTSLMINGRMNDTRIPSGSRTLRLISAANPALVVVRFSDDVYMRVITLDGYNVIPTAPLKELTLYSQRATVQLVDRTGAHVDDVEGVSMFAFSVHGDPLTHVELNWNLQDERRAKNIARAVIGQAPPRPGLSESVRQWTIPSTEVKNLEIFKPKYSDGPPSCNKMIIADIKYDLQRPKDFRWRLGDFLLPGEHKEVLLWKFYAGYALNSQDHIEINSGECVDVVIQNLQAGSHAHAFHLHGPRFWLLGRGSGSFVPGKTHLNLSNPLRRDTVICYPNSHVVIRICGFHSGIFLLHCHFSNHLDQGLGTYVVVGKESLPRPPLLDGHTAPFSSRFRQCAV